jgi:hypothetical protein
MSQYVFARTEAVLGVFIRRTISPKKSPGGVSGGGRRGRRRKEKEKWAVLLGELSPRKNHQQRWQGREEGHKERARREGGEGRRVK